MREVRNTSLSRLHVLTSNRPETYRNEKLELSDWAGQGSTEDDNESDEAESDDS